MKAFVKLLFVVLLIGWALVWPGTVRAAGDFPVGQYQCTNPWTACYNSTTQEMAQCMGRCYEYGGGQEELCYNTVDTITYSDGDYIVDTAQTCNEVPSGEYTCAQACVNNFGFEMGNCFSQYCSLQ